MDLLCKGIADWCKKNGAVSQENYPIILYGIQVMLNTSLKVAGILLTGAMLRRLPQVILSTVAFCSMRYWTGGWHSKSHLGCFCTMLIPCVGPSLLTGISGEWVSWVMGGMAIYSVYKVWRYAPYNSMVNPIEDERSIQRKKIGAIVETGCLLGIILLLKNVEIGLLIINPLCIEAILILRDISHSTKM